MNTSNDRSVPTGMFGIARDVAASPDAEQALRESESKLRSLFENLPDVVVLIDRNAHILFVNRDQPNARRKTLIGECAFDLVTPEYQTVCRRGLDQAIATGRPQAFETQDVVGRWWSCQAVPLAEKDGAPGMSWSFAPTSPRNV